MTIFLQAGEGNQPHCLHWKVDLVDTFAQMEKIAAKGKTNLFPRKHESVPSDNVRASEVYLRTIDDGIWCQDCHPSPSLSGLVLCAHCMQLEKASAEGSHIFNNSLVVLGGMASLWDVCSSKASFEVRALVVVASVGSIAALSVWDDFVVRLAKALLKAAS